MGVQRRIARDGDVNHPGDRGQGDDRRTGVRGRHRDSGGVFPDLALQLDGTVMGGLPVAALQVLSEELDARVRVAAELLAQRGLSVRGEDVDP